ncbi:PQ loop repeat-domain-containing protein [Stachybotrys elegans]|uniref:PQ loop repeat-domain-containing protein n=1 Tax=Stachybotrys elegans TaxID=80388 RepID=A0A8K0SIF6_9HYPO|nr:PQ loop repeat-domain-containing protein [Stachybotrys elegans]
MDSPVAANILGTAGAVCWSIQLLPQIFKNYRLHSTQGLHPQMYISWALAGIPLGTYNVVQNLNIALQVQAHILIFLSLVAWAQCKYYGDGWGVARILAYGAAVGACIGGVEAGLYFGLREAWNRGVEWPMTVMAVLAAVLLAVGVMRYYWEIYQSRSVQGISFLFVAIDAGGDLFSILALLFAERIDVVGMVVYATELILWIGIGLLGAHYRLRAWIRGKTGRKDALDVEEPSPAEANGRHLHGRERQVH